MRARYFGLLSPGETKPEMLFATEEWLARAYNEVPAEMRRRGIVRVVIVDVEIHSIEEKH